jgi:prepilin-type N-terminal cleavage/methylation domain-containing protein
MRHPRGFTLVELSIGMVITSLVIGAAASFMLAVSSSYRAADNDAAMQVIDTQVHARLQKEIRGACLIGAVRPGSLTNPMVAPAAVLIWAKDGNSTSIPVVNPDGLVQDAEIVMLEYDPANKVINKYTAASTPQGSTRTWTAMENTPPDQFAGFKSGKTATILLKNVTACTFNRIYDSTSSASPVLEYRLEMKKSDSTNSFAGGAGVSDIYGVATVRAPVAQPVP